MGSAYNARSPSVKRIFREIKEMNELMSEQEDGTAQFAAEALESDIFEWHFAVRGPDGTDFESGIYHGRILLPHDYPFKPPSFIMLTPSGRFETQTKICLSISSYHPEHWQPSWSMRTALTALIAFFPTPADSAIGSLTTSSEERKRLAAESRESVPKGSTTERTDVMQRLHSLLLRTKVGATQAPDPVPECTASLDTENKEASSIANHGPTDSVAAPSRPPSDTVTPRAGVVHHREAEKAADCSVSHSSPQLSVAHAVQDRQEPAAAACNGPQGRHVQTSRTVVDATAHSGAGRRASESERDLQDLTDAPTGARSSVTADAQQTTRNSAQQARIDSGFESLSERMEAWLPQSEGELHKWRAIRDLIWVLETVLLVMAGIHIVYPVI